MKNCKKTTVLLLIIAVVCSTAVLAMAGCTSEYDIMYVSDTGNVLDSSYNEAIWTAIESYGKETGVKFATISALGQEDKDFQRTIKKCINSYKAKYIVLSSAKFRSILTEEFANKFPTTTFIYFEDTSHSTNNESYNLVDKAWVTNKKAGNYTIKVEHKEYSYPLPANVICLQFDQYELGYAAGYAAAQLGKDIAFFGSSASRPVFNADGYALGKDGTTTINDKTNPIAYETYTTKSMQKYYDGFIAGVSAFAGADVDEYSVQYTIGRQDDSDRNKRAILDKMVQGGIDVVFAAAGEGYNTKLRDICNEKGYQKFIINADIDLTVADDADTKLSHGSILRSYAGGIRYVLKELAKTDGTSAVTKGSLVTLNNTQDGIGWAFLADVSVDMSAITYAAPATLVSATEIK